MHRTIDELLALRDGEADPEVDAHVAECAHCAREVERLGEVADALRSLPQVSPPRDEKLKKTLETMRLIEQATKELNEKYSVDDGGECE